tara:strand:- start:41 stop:538 length:498 start_codon:yes stop_codon:yes gene_type:complete
MSTLKVTNLQKLDGTTFPVGKIIQHISTSTTDNLSTSSGTFAEIGTGYRLTITPTSTSNTILIRYMMGWEDNNAGGRDVIYTIYKDGTTNLANAAGLFDDMSYNYNASRFQNAGRIISFVDATTNSTAERYYTLFGRTSSGSAVQFNSANANGRRSFCEVMEIAT